MCLEYIKIEYFSLADFHFSQGDLELNPHDGGRVYCILYQQFLSLICR